jgi:hypothetical protein
MSDNATPSAWYRSRFCSDGACIEARRHNGMIYVRQSQDEQRELRLTPAVWNDFLAGVKRGDFD